MWYCLAVVGSRFQLEAIAEQLIPDWRIWISEFRSHKDGLVMDLISYHPFHLHDLKHAFSYWPIESNKGLWGLLSAKTGAIYQCRADDVIASNSWLEVAVAE